MVYFFIKVIKHGISLLKTIRLRLFTRNLKLGKSVIIYYKSRIYNFSKGEILVGSNSRIGSSSIQNHVGMPFYTRLINDGIKSTIVIGEGCRINGAYIHAKERITIGDRCVIASGVNIIDSNGHEVYSLDRTSGTDEPSPIIIGNNVWIGVNATILKGTNIDDNCVVSAGSVVKGVFPSNSIIQGNPAKVVKTIEIEKNAD